MRERMRGALPALGQIGVLVLGVCLLAGSARAAMTVSDLRELLQAGRQRCRQVEMEARTCFFNIAEDGALTADGQEELTWRTDGSKTYAKQVLSFTPRRGKTPAPYTNEFQLEERFGKMLRTAGKDNRGVIDVPGEVDSAYNTWDLFAGAWFPVNGSRLPLLEAPDAKIASVGNIHTVTGMLPNGRTATLVVDGDKGFLPLSYEEFNASGKRIVLYATGDIAEVDRGVWLPRRTEVTWDTRHRKTVVEVATLRVNQPVPPEKLRLTFPVGTRVHDKVAGLDYVISLPEVPNFDERPTTATSDPRVVEPADLVVQNPATDEQLRETARSGPVGDAGGKIPVSLLLAAGVLVAVVLGVILWRRRQSRRVQP